MMNQLIIATQELNKKDMEIKSLRSQDEQLRNELSTKKELLERMKKQSEVVKYFEELMRSPRSKRDTSRLGYINHFSSTKEGESSKSGEQRNDKSKGNPTCHYCGKLGHRTDICRSKNGMQTSKPNYISNFLNCKKVDTKHMNTYQRKVIHPQQLDLKNITIIIFELKRNQTRGKTLTKKMVTTDRLPPQKITPH